MIGYLHITKSEGINCCVLSKDTKAKEIICYTRQKEGVLYEIALQFILDNEKKIINNDIDRVIIITDKNNIYRHIIRCKKRKKETYNYEKVFLGQSSIEIMISLPVFYSRATRYCNLNKNPQIVQK